MITLLKPPNVTCEGSSQMMISFGINFLAQPLGLIFYLSHGDEFPDLTFGIKTLGLNPMLPESGIFIIKPCSV